MGWLSNNFPTIAKLFGGANKGPSRARQTPERGHRRGRNAETPQPRIEDFTPSTENSAPVAVATAPETTTDQPPEAVESRPVEQSAAQEPTAAAPQSTTPPAAAPQPAVSQDIETVQAGDQRRANTPATVSADSSIGQMYNTWVELEGTIVAAQSELRSLLGNREEAEAMRTEAQEAMVEADAAWREAGLLGEAAWRAFERGFSVDSPDFVNRLRVIKEVDDARKAQAQLQRASNLEAWKEADRARQNATADIL